MWKVRTLNVLEVPFGPDTFFIKLKRQVAFFGFLPQLIAAPAERRFVWAGRHAERVLPRHNKIVTEVAVHCFARNLRNHLRAFLEIVQQVGPAPPCFGTI